MIRSRTARGARRAGTAELFRPGPVETVDVGHDLVDLPIRYYRTDCFLAIFAADFEAVAATLPSARLTPVRVTGGRAAVAVVAYNYLETGVGSYGEIGVAALCTLDGTAPPLLPLLRETADPRFGAFVLHLPVTTRIARDAGRTVWGYPKFTADMAFDLRPERRGVTLHEGGDEILRLQVRNQGRLVRDDKPVVTFTEHHGDLFRTSVATRAVYHLGVGRRHGRLELGNHEVAGQLSGLGIATEALATKSYVAHAAVLPTGEPIGPADRPARGFSGTDAPFGRHTVRYDDGVERVVTEPDAPERSPASVAALVNG